MKRTSATSTPIEIRPDVTSGGPKRYPVKPDDLEADDPSEKLAILGAVLTAAAELRPRIEPPDLTDKTASHSAELAQTIQARIHDPEHIAHYLDRILSTLFAEGAGVPPKDILQRLSQAASGTSGQAQIDGMLDVSRVTTLVIDDMHGLAEPLTPASRCDRTHVRTTGGEGPAGLVFGGSR